MNIGYISLWFPRGQTYITKTLMKATESEHENFLLVRGTPGLELPKNALVNEDYNISEETFVTWIKSNKLDYIVFNEENQWVELRQDCDLVRTAKSLGVKTIGYLIWEKFNPFNVDSYKTYDTIICQTNCFFELCKRSGLSNAKRIKWGCDLKLFSPKKISHEKTVFFHPAGWGGVHNRKNTEAVVEAFNHLRGDDVKLIITDQRQKNENFSVDNGRIQIIGGTLPMKELIEIYQNCHAVILPSKWEGLGIPFLEAIACGKPVITVDAPPMNELVLDNKTGATAKIKKQENYPGICVPGMIVDEFSLAKKMMIFTNKMLCDVLSDNARKYAEDNFDWDKNKKSYLEIFQ